MTRLERLERIADFAMVVRSLERDLPQATKPRLTLDRLYVARVMLDEALEDFKQNERDQSDT